MKEVCGLITVRSESSRLPRKCFLPLGDVCVLESIVHRCLFYKITPIICTTTSVADNSIEALAKKLNVLVFRGSIKNKMKRWLKCAELYYLEDFHTIDADDPFFDGDLVLKSMKLRRESNLDFVKPSFYSSNGAGSVGYSIKSDYLGSLINNTEDSLDTEMIDQIIASGLGCSSQRIKENPILDYQIRLTLDYEEDYWLIASIVKILGSVPSREEIIELFKRNPDLHLLNFHRNLEWSKNQKDILSKNNIF